MVVLAVSRSFYAAMPNASTSIMAPGYRKGSAGGNSPLVVDQEKIHLPVIRNDSSKAKPEKKQSKFLEFHNERHSFTENLLSFFTGGRDHFSSQNTAAMPVATGKPAVSSKKDAVGQAGGTMRGSRRRTSSFSNAKNETIVKSSNKWTGRAHPQLKRTDSNRITAATKTDTFRPVTSSSITKKENGKAVSATPDVESDPGGYETMYKMKQPAGKSNVPRKQAVELSEYLRKENYRYNERIAKNFLFQKWLKSTERAFPELHLVETVK